MHNARRVVVPLLVATLALTALAGSGCGPRKVEREPAPVGSTVEEPGRYELPDDRTLVLGVLVRRDVEGGFWAVVDAKDAGSADDAEVLAVLLDLEKVAHPQDLEGEYVMVQGRLADGASIRMAGPELRVETIDRLDGAPPAETTGSTTPTSSEGTTP